MYKIFQIYRQGIFLSFKFCQQCVNAALKYKWWNVTTKLLLKNCLVKS